MPSDTFGTTRDNAREEKFFAQISMIIMFACNNRNPHS